MNPSPAQPEKPEIIDAHIHIWELSQDKYHWDPAYSPPPQFEARLEAIQALMAQTHVNRAVLIQPGSYGPDASLIADTVAAFPRQFIGMGMVDPTQPDATDQAAYWIEEKKLAGFRLRGVWLDAPYLRAYWEKAATYQAALAIFTGPIDLAPLDRLLDELPPTPVLIDHFGHRRLNDPAHCQQLLKLARHPHVRVKMSGLYALSAQPHPHPDAAGLIQDLLEAFGPQRLLWASDFPYITQTDGYAACVEWFRHDIPATSQEDRDWICGRTAAELWPKP